MGSQSFPELNCFNPYISGIAAVLSPSYKGNSNVIAARSLSQTLGLLRVVQPFQQELDFSSQKFLFPKIYIICDTVSALRVAQEQEDLWFSLSTVGDCRSPYVCWKFAPKD